MNAPAEDVVVVARVNDGLSAVGRVLLTLVRGSHRVSRLTFESVDDHGGAQLVLEVRAIGGGERLVRQINRIVSVVDIVARPVSHRNRHGGQYRRV